MSSPLSFVPPPPTNSTFCVASLATSSRWGLFWLGALRVHIRHLAFACLHRSCVLYVPTCCAAVVGVVAPSPAPVCTGVLHVFACGAAAAGECPRGRGPFGTFVPFLVPSLAPPCLHTCYTDVAEKYGREGGRVRMRMMRMRVKVCRAGPTPNQPAQLGETCRLTYHHPIFRRGSKCRARSRLWRGAAPPFSGPPPRRCRVRWLPRQAGEAVLNGWRVCGFRRAAPPH